MQPAPLQILSSVLLWNFALTRQLEKLPNKMQRDFVPTLINGQHHPCALSHFCIQRPCPNDKRRRYQLAALTGHLQSEPGSGGLVMTVACRMEVLGASIGGQLLGCATAIQSAVDVHLWTVLGWVSILHIQRLGAGI